MANTAYNDNNTQNIPPLKSLVGPDLGRPPAINILAAALTYADPTTPGDEPLIDPVQDMEHIRTKLPKSNRIRFTTLYESAATRCNILNSLQDELPKCRLGDLFVLYLAGHAYSDTGYEFVTYYEQQSEQPKARLSYRDILEYVQKYCPPGVQVLQIRDTCHASPNPEEERMLLHQDGSVMVLAACAVDQLSYETSSVPHSLFLKRLVPAAEALISVAPEDLRASLTIFLNTILSPIPVPIPKRPQQDPQLVPRESKPKFISLLTDLIRQLQDEFSD